MNREAEISEEDRIHDIEIVVRCILRGAVSKRDLARYYKDDPLICAVDLAANEEGLCGTIDAFHFEIIKAKLQ